MKSIPSTVVSGRQLFKVVTITLHRSHQMIESDSEEEAMELALQMKPVGEVIQQHAVVTVSGIKPGHYCHV